MNARMVVSGDGEAMDKFNFAVGHSMPRIESRGRTAIYSLPPAREAVAMNIAKSLGLTARVERPSDLHTETT